MYKILFILLACIPIFGDNLKNVTLVLPWKNQFQFAGYYAAKELGLYKQAGLNVIIKEYDFSRKNVDGVASGEFDFGIGHSEIILDTLNKKQNISFLAAIFQSSPLILLSTQRNDIQNLVDVRNKKIMMSQNQHNIASILAMLHTEQITSNDYVSIESDFNPAKLIDGSADIMIAYASNEPYSLKEKGINYKIFDPKDYAYDFYSDILYTSTVLTQTQPELVKSFFRASMQGWDYAFSNIEKTTDIILQKYNTQRRTKKALLFEASVLKKLAYIKGTEFGDINPLRIKDILNTYRLLSLANETSIPNIHKKIYHIKRLGKEQNMSNGDKRLLVIKQTLKYYQYYIYLFLFFFISTLFMMLYFRNKVKRKLKRKMKELDKNNEIFDKNISTVRTDLDGNITHISQAFCKTSGYNKEELIGKNPRVFKADDSLSDEHYKDLWMTIQSGHTWKGEFKNLKKDGSPYWSEAIISPILDINNIIIGYEGIRQDITLKKVLEEFNQKLEEEVLQRTKELEKLAITDKLTSLFNRVKIDTQLKYQVNNFKRNSHTFSIIMIDIDFFKDINDTYGHQVGDEVLIALSKILKQSVREVDILGRWGGEEFIIICPNTDEDGAFSLAEIIRINVQEHKYKSIDKLSISCGVASIDDTLDENSILKKADKALYRAKELGRNRVQR